MASVFQALIGGSALLSCALMALGVSVNAEEPTQRPQVDEAPAVVAPADEDLAPSDVDPVPALSADESADVLVSSPPVARPVLQPEPALPVPNPEQADESRRLYRICRVTAYCDRGKTAVGVQSGIGQCAAPGDIPFGSIVYIPSLDRKFVVTDRTHRRFRRSTVDLFMPSKSMCKQFGCRYLEVEITLPEEGQEWSYVHR